LDKLPLGKRFSCAPFIYVRKSGAVDPGNAERLWDLSLKLIA
jgi:hypothetical protein